MYRAQGNGARARSLINLDLVDARSRQDSIVSPGSKLISIQPDFETRRVAGRSIIAAGLSICFGHPRYCSAAGIGNILATSPPRDRLAFLTSILDRMSNRGRKNTDSLADYYSNSLAVKSALYAVQIWIVSRSHCHRNETRSVIRQSGNQSETRVIYRVVYSLRVGRKTWMSF